MAISSLITIGLISVILLLWLIWRRRCMTLFERLGIPGPKPNLITGNVNSCSDAADISIQWEKKYGKIYGIYMGARPFLVVSDVELLKQIQVKEFKTFMARSNFLNQLAMAHSLSSEVMFSKTGEQWKNIRCAATPAFTTGKLRKMLPIAIEAIDIFLEKIHQTNQETFDIVPLFKRLSFDVNSRASFGISTGVQNDDKSLFIRSAYRSFDGDSGDLLAAMLDERTRNSKLQKFVCFPELSPLPQLLRIIRDKIRSYLKLPSVDIVIETCTQIIKIRKNNPEAERPDLLQSLLDACKVFREKNTKRSTAKGVLSSHTPLTEREVIANAYGFMLGGFDSVSILLSFCIHYLTEYPQMQVKLREEINANVKGKVEYDDLSNLPYLEQVISETLRIFPFSVVGITRTSVAEFKYNGITIPKDMNIGIALHALNMDPNYWDEPEKFKPERFSPENGEINSIVYQPFGEGPRHCIGKRAAMVITKTILASLIQKFKLEKPADAKNFDLEYSVFFVRPKNGVQVRAIPV